MSKKPTSMVLPPRQPMKGEASASVRSIEERVPETTSPPDQPLLQQERSPTPLPPNVKALGGMVAVTVRMDRDTYERLKFRGIRTRKTNQDMLLTLIQSMLATEEG